MTHNRPHYYNNTMCVIHLRYSGVHYVYVNKVINLTRISLKIINIFHYTNLRVFIVCVFFFFLHQTGTAFSF